MHKCIEIDQCFQLILASFKSFRQAALTGIYNQDVSRPVIIISEWEWPVEIQCGIVIRVFDQETRDLGSSPHWVTMGLSCCHLNLLTDCCEEKNEEKESCVPHFELKVGIQFYD